MSFKRWVQKYEVRGVLFDLDGVLVDSRGLHDQALRLALDELQLPYLTPLPWSDEALRTSQKLFLLGIRDEGGKIRDLKARRYRELLCEAGRLRFQNADAMRRAFTGLEYVGLVTTCGWEGDVLGLSLRLLGLEKRGFDQIFAPYDGATKKESMYKAAYQWVQGCRYGYPITDTLVIEDSDVGVAAALAAGFTKIKQVTFEQLREAL